MQETQEMWVPFLGPEDPLGKKMASHCRILAWKVPRTEEPGGLQFRGSQRVRHDSATDLARTHTVYIFQCCSICPTLFPLLGPQVCSLRLCFYSCPADRFISTIFLDSVFNALTYDIFYLSDLRHPFLLGSRVI